MIHPVFDRIARVAARAPDAVALEQGAVRVTYGDLIARARAIGDAHGWCAGDLVALCMPRSTEYIVAMLGVWGRSAAFTPIAPDDPPERRRAMLDGCRATCLVESLIATPTRLRSVDEAAHDPALSYVIHTSGSTGKPKAVMMHAGGLLGVIDAQIEAFRVREGARALWMLSQLFDASLSDIGCALCAGATLVIAPDAMAPHDLLRLLHAQRITHADIPPSYLRHIDPDEAPETLQTLVIGGEVPPPQVIAWSQRAGLRILNVYGPTETTICATAQVVDGSFDPTRIGAPLSSAIQLRVCAPDQAEPGEALPVGAAGELWIGGAHVGLGYMGASALAAARFVTDAEGVRWYRTGDRVVIDAEGRARFLGRLDRQLKRNGRLISPEEIEAHLLQHPALRRVHVAEASRGVLGCAYEHEGDATPETLRAHLLARLPAWMIPDLWRPLDALPLSHTGKVQPNRIDWRAARSSPQPNTTRSALMTWLEATCAPILDTTLDPALSFAEHGGDSLAALEIAALAAAEGLALNPEALMSAPRLDQLRADDRASTETLRALASALPLPPGHDCAPPTDDSPRRVLLTGATGQLGGHVLAALKAQDIRDIQDIQITCLVRPTSAPLAHDDQIVGDLRLPDLGLSDEDRARLEQTNYTEIIHCAGVVNLARDLAFHRAGNLDALHHLLHLQHTLGCRLHHVSTLSVFVHTDHVPERCREDDPLTTARHVFGGYAQSKLAADLLALRAAQDRPVHVYRPGLLTPPASAPGWPRPELMPMTLRGLAHLGVYPEALAETLRVDLTPLDWAAARIVSLIWSNAPGPHHISHASASLGQLARALARAGRPLRPVTLAQWRALPHDLLQRADARVAWLALSRRARADEAHHAVDLFQATGTRFTDAQATAAEADALLDRYVHMALDPTHEGSP